MSIDQIGSEALKLPVQERARLAASLWESLGDPFEATVAVGDDEVLALAMERDAELESGAVSPLSHASLMERLRG